MNVAKEMSTYTNTDNDKNDSKLRPASSILKKPKIKEKKNVVFLKKKVTFGQNEVESFTKDEPIKQSTPFSFTSLGSDSFSLPTFEDKDGYKKDIIIDLEDPKTAKNPLKVTFKRQCCYVCMSFVLKKDLFIHPKIPDQVNP